MFKRFLSPPTRMPREVQDEILSLCRSTQIEDLALSPHLRRDVGLDCGCAQPSLHNMTTRAL
jgi:hypothetical protein